MLHLFPGASVGFLTKPARSSKNLSAGYPGNIPEKSAEFDSIFIIFSSQTAQYFALYIPCFGKIGKIIEYEIITF